MHRLTLLALAVVATTASARVEAQETSEQDDAREAFRLGGEAAAEERWADSELWFGRAYELSGVPSALFNRAVALRALGRHSDARDAFRTLLTLEIEDTVRADAQRLLREEEQRVLPAGSDAHESGGTSEPAAWGLLVVGGIVAAVGAVLLAIGVADRQAVQGAADGELEWSDAEARLEVADILGVTGGVGIGVGVALAATSIVLFASTPDHVEVAVRGTRLTLGGRF